jgi:translation initiation factor 2 gamma subunit (eIF-2gamma)
LIERIVESTRDGKQLIIISITVDPVEYERAELLESREDIKQFIDECSADSIEIGGLSCSVESIQEG